MQKSFSSLLLFDVTAFTAATANDAATAAFFVLEIHSYKRYFYQVQHVRGFLYALLKVALGSFL